MNKYLFIIKILTKDGKRFNWKIILPFFGTIVGTITVVLTFSIMQGMEDSIFKKLESISFPLKLSNISLVNSIELENVLIENDIGYEKGIESNIMVVKDDYFKMVTIHGIDNFNKFKDKLLGNSKLSVDTEGVVIGKALAYRLNVDIGEPITLIDVEQINIFTGMPYVKTLKVSGIYDFNIINYDQNHIFCNYSSINNFLLDDNRLLYSYNFFDRNIISQKFPEINFTRWDEEYKTFISAMRLEKFIYTGIGYIIVLLASFTLLSIMSLNVIQKLPQIGILRSLGMNRYNISYIFIFQALMTSVLSAAVGLMLSYVIIYFNNSYNLIQSLFPKVLIFDFKLSLSYNNAILIFMCSVLLMLIASVFPSVKAANIDPIKSISFKR